MTKQYWINDTLIDLTRNQIKRYRQVESLQPKTLAVLTILAKHAGQVVNHDTLMKEVWGNSIVAPNSLQRCIVQLRKALGDDGKTQTLIKTHAKQGYSLEAKIKWSDDQQTNTNTRQNIFWPISIAGLVVFLLIVIGMQVSKPNPTFNRITPVTASDEREFYGSYSPDGRYLVFHRYLGFCENHIWAKDLQTQQETRLTQTAGIYGLHEWSIDGNQLVFTLQESCNQNKTQYKNKEDICWRLQTLDFAAALQSPQAAQQRLDCAQDKINNPQWLNDGNIALLKYQNRNAKLVRYDARSDTLTDLYAPTENQLYSYEYIPKYNNFAAVSVTPESQHILERLDINGKHLSSSIIQRPSELSHYQNYYISLHPNEEWLTVYTKQALYTLSFGGKLSKVDIPNFHNLHHVTFHPDNDKLIATQGITDTDIAKIHLNEDKPVQTEAKFNQAYAPYPSIARSTAEDQYGQFQPNGSLIAFISQRSGSQQLWVYNDNGSPDEQAQQLSRFKAGSYITSFAWSPSGKQLAATVNDDILLIALNGRQTALKVDRPIQYIYQWVNPNQLLVDTGGTNAQILLLDINNSAVSKTGVNNILWAQISRQNELIYIDHNKKLWRLRNTRTDEAPEFLTQLSGKLFSLRDRNIYGINPNNELFTYQLDQRSLNILKKLDKQVWWLNDTNDQYILVTQVISARKEIVEISH